MKNRNWVPLVTETINAANSLDCTLTIMVLGTVEEPEGILYVCDEGDFVNVYGSLDDAMFCANALAVMTPEEWSDHDRAGEHGACSVCDNTHTATRLQARWRDILGEVLAEEKKTPKYEEA